MKTNEVRAEWIEWVDSVVVEPGWRPLGDDLDIHLIESMGFVVRETKTSVVLAQSIDKENGNLCGAITVPKVAILRRVRLGLLGAKPKRSTKRR
jgi:hypothetical protein